MPNKDLLRELVVEIGEYGFFDIPDTVGASLDLKSPGDYLIDGLRGGYRCELVELMGKKNGNEIDKDIVKPIGEDILVDFSKQRSSGYSGRIAEGTIFSHGMNAWAYARLRIKDKINV